MQMAGCLKYFGQSWGCSKNEISSGSRGRGNLKNVPAQHKFLRAERKRIDSRKNFIFNFSKYLLSYC